MENVRLERTSKSLKATILASFVVMLASAAAAWQLWGTPQLPYTGIGFGVGAILYLTARALAWWQYG